MNTDVIIIGGGVLGISLAYHLSHRGVGTCLLEREASWGLHASGKNAGMFRHLYRHEQLTKWAQCSKSTWPEAIHQEAFRQTGSLILGRRAPVHHKHLFEERLVEGIPAVYTAEDGLLDPHIYVSQLVQLRERRYAEMLFKKNVSSIERKRPEHGSLWEVTCTDGSMFCAPWLVNAAGAWLNDFLSPELRQEAQPFARHLFVSSGWPASFLSEKEAGYLWEEEEGWYTRLWDEGRQLLSVCDKLPVESPESYIPSASVQEEAAKKLLAALPQIADRIRLERSWHCFRTYTDDQLPIWGESLPGLFWLAAFGGFGMSTSFGATSDAARAISGENPSVSKDFLPRSAPDVHRMRA